MLLAIANPKYAVSCFTNKDLQQHLGALSWAKGMTGKQLSVRISRHLRLLREPGLIKKLPHQRRYRLTDKGRKITMGLNVIFAASTEQLLEKAV